MLTAFKAGHYEHSLRLAEKAALEAPQFFDHHRIRILSLSRMQRHDEAMSVSKSVMALFPDDLAACGLAVSVAIASSDFDACLDLVLRLTLIGGSLNSGLLNNVLKNATIQSDRRNPTSYEAQSHFEGQIRMIQRICDATGRRLIFMIGNCQVPVLAEILNNTPAFSERWFAYCYKGVHACSPAELVSMKASMGHSDCIVTQNISADSFGPLRTETIRPSYHGRLLTIPTCWFNTTSLDAFRLSQMRLGNPDANMHSVFLARAFLEGLSAVEAVARYEDAALFTDKVLNDNLFETEVALRQRDRFLDIAITDYVVEMFIEKRLFYSYNHPTLAVLLEVCAGLMEYLGLPFQKDMKRYATFDRLVNPLWQTHPKIRRHFGLRYAIEPGFVFNGQSMDILSFTHREYELFAKQDSESLSKDVGKKEQELKYSRCTSGA